MRRSFTLTSVGALLVAGVSTTRAQSTACTTCVAARFWEIESSAWNGAATASPTPERARLEESRPFDVGIAFSGGGTRSASAVIGQLRALNALGWLPRIRYVAAASGGAWAAVPFTYYQGSLTDLLGTGAIDPATIERVPNGLLAERVVKSGLAHLALQEAATFLPSSAGDRDLSNLRSAVLTTRKSIRAALGRSVAEPDRPNKTYAHALGRIFLDGLVPDGARRPYAWDRQTAIDMSVASGLSAGDFVVPALDRPFLIVTGTLVKPSGSDYPRLIPVEYTPLYTGIRQRFGGIGGTYLWPWAYDRLRAAPLSDTTVLVGPKPNERVFTLADVIASSGAAPQLELMLGEKLPERGRRAARELSDVFPSFSNLTVRGRVPNAPSTELAHGDGGFSDNLAIMPLLARHVRNVMVFVNSSSHYAQNAQLQSYFMPVALRDGMGDKTMNPVFGRGRYKEVLDGFDRSTATGLGAIYCARGWSVSKNEIYNIAGYDTLNICWIYNHPAAKWRDSLPEPVKSWVAPPKGSKAPKQAKQLVRFPYYSTFLENKPRVIKLNPLQVNLLADLASWSVSNPAAVDTIVTAFTEAVLPRPKPRY